MILGYNANEGMYSFKLTEREYGNLLDGGEIVKWTACATYPSGAKFTLKFSVRGEAYNNE